MFRLEGPGWNPRLKRGREREREKDCVCSSGRIYGYWMADIMAVCACALATFYLCDCPL